MPSSKSCLVCGKELVILINRDKTRKKFCSVSCRNSAGTRTRIAALPNRECVTCGTMFKKKSTTQITCSKECYSPIQVRNSYKYLNGNMDAYILHLIKKKGRKHLTVAQITELYQNQQGVCAISKIPLTCIKIPNTKRVHTNLSLDRIDSDKGYDLSNIQLVCSIVNVMKSNLTMEEFKMWIQAIQGGLQNS